MFYLCSMLPALRHRLKSRLSPFKVIPPIGAPIYNFQNHDDNIWAILQNIKEIEKALSQETARALSSLTKEELNSSPSDQQTNFQQNEAIKSQRVNNHDEKGYEDEEKCAEEGCRQVPWSSCDSEVEFSINIGSQIVHRYSSSEEEISFDSEF